MTDTDLRHQLDRLARSGADDAIPLGAAEVRRRGRARARRRTGALSATLVTAAMLTAVMAVGLDRDGSPARPVAAAPPTAAATTGGADPAGSSLADGQTGISAPAPDDGPPVDPAVLLTTSELPDSAEEPYEWSAVGFRSDTPDLTLPCALGSTAVLDETLPGATRAFEAAGGGAGLMEEVRRFPAEASTADAVATLATRLEECTGDSVTTLERSPYGLSAHLERVAGGDTTSVDLVVAGRGTTVVALYARGRGDQPGQQVLTALMTTALDRAAR